MDIRKTPGGTRGARQPAMPKPLARLLARLMERQHRRTGDTFMGMNLLYLTTIGAKSGQERRTPVAFFAEEGGWLVVASLAGAARHPGWYHNVAAHPGQVRAEVAGNRHRVVAEQLEGARRSRAWERITAEQPRYAGYQDKTDRVLPVLLLTPAA